MAQKNFIDIDQESRIPKYKQVLDSILANIKNGELTLGDKIPSINSVSEEYDLSRDTVEKAYKMLKDLNIIDSVRGKGYYIMKTDFDAKIKILFLINKLSNYKMRIFNTFVNALSTNALVDLDIYHCEPSLFIDKIDKKTSSYDYMIVMPHFKSDNMRYLSHTKETLAALNNINPEKLIIMDANIKQYTRDCGKIYQDFTEDIYEALKLGYSKIRKYKKFILVYPSKEVYPYPDGIVFGFKKFCSDQNIDFEILDEIYEGMELQVKDLYVIIQESDLVNLVKQVRERHFKIGEEIGIISYNDTPLKELLGISVISTDFQKMGLEAAKMILDNDFKDIKNDFNLIDRNSI